jgi:hypothetical protein
VKATGRQGRSSEARQEGRHGEGTPGTVTGFSYVGKVEHDHGGWAHERGIKKSKKLSDKLKKSSEKLKKIVLGHLCKN